MKDTETQDTETIRSESVLSVSRIFCFIGIIGAGMSTMVSISVNFALASKGLQVKPFESAMLFLATLAFSSAFMRMTVKDQR